jgi:sialidase-1
LERTNESTVAELRDGNLMLNMRSSHRDGARMIAVSTDGGITWPSIQPDTALVEPVCQGSLLSYRPKKKKHVLFFSNPAARTRTNMTIKMSTDNGRSWKKSYTVYSGPSAYSDLVMVPGGEVAILYEAGVKKPYEGIAFEVVAPDSFE